MSTNNKLTPWEEFPDVWKNETYFFNYIRGCLRKAWVRHPTKLKKLNEARFQIPNTNPRAKKATVWGCKCEVCGNLFPMKDIEVDHIVPAGRLQCLEDIQGFVERLLFVTTKDLRIVCKKTCHAAITLSEKNGISFQEALAEKTAIGLIKEKKDKEWLTDKGIVPASNQKSRRQQIVEYLRSSK